MDIIGRRRIGHKHNQIIGGIFLSYAAQILQILVTLFYTPIMLKMLGQSEYGLYQLAYSVASYLSLFSFGFSSSYIKFFSSAKIKEKPEDEVAKVNGVFMAVFGTLGMVVLAVGFLAVFHTDVILGGKLTEAELQKSAGLLAVMVVNCAISFPATVFHNYIIANEKFIWLQGINILSTVLNPCLTFPLLLMGYASMSLASALLLITLINSISAGAYCRKQLHMKFIFRSMKLSLLKDIGQFSFFIFIESIISTINISLDRFLLGKLVSSVSVAVYAVGGQINTLYTTLSQSICAVFVPRINQLVADGNREKELSDLFVNVGKIQYAILLAVLSGYLIYGRRFMTLWAGKEYGESFIIALLLIIPNTVNLIQNIGVEIQRARNMQKYRSYIYIGIAAANILISINLIGKWGAAGAAMGTGLAWIVGGGFIMNYFFCRYVKLDVKRFWKEMWKLSKGVVLPLAAGCLLRRFLGFESIWSYFLQMVVYMAFYLVSMFYFGLNKNERKWAIGRIKSIVTKNR